MAKFEPGMEAMLDMFVFETAELLEKLDDILMKTEMSGPAAEDVNEIFRIMHTVKGSAAMMGLQNMSALAHSLEDLFFVIREDPSVTYDKEELYELLYAGSDGLKAETENISDDSVPLTDFGVLIAKNRAFAEVMKGGSAQQEEKTSETTELFSDDEPDDLLTYKIIYEPSCMMPDIRAMVLLNHIKTSAEVVRTVPADLDAESAGEEIAANGFIVKLKTGDPDMILEQMKSGINVQSVERLERPKNTEQTEKASAADVKPETTPQTSAIGEKSNAASAKKSEDKSGAMISVKLEKLDRLMRLAAEIVIAQSGVLHSRDLAPYRNQMPNFYKSARDLKKLTDELQDMVMSVRMVPVSTAFSKMNRVVRDMNKKLGKNVTLVFEGEQTEVDKSVADMLGDPLMHLVRNAVDHGIESAEERAETGKTEPPTVTLKACYESNDVLISVADNGAGMDAGALLNKARSKGILTKPEQEYSEQECFELIMSAGFSTNEKVTEYSGRGVGMDVVKKNLEKVGGTLSVDSVYGKGSEFTIRVPMSLSISDCMAIMLGGQEYAVPVTAITEAFRAKPEQLVTTPDGKEMVQRDKLYKIIRLSEHFGLEGCVSDCSEGIMLLCSTPQGEAALFADGIVEDMQIVIKPFSAYLSKFGLKAAGFSGTSVLGDGSIILTLDVNEIIKRGISN